MNADVRRLLLDYPRRLGWRWGVAAFFFALMAQAVSPTASRLSVPFTVGLVFQSLSLRQFGKDWMRATATLPVPRRDFALARWLAAFGLPIAVMIAAYLVVIVLFLFIPPNKEFHAPTLGEGMLYALLAWAAFAFFHAINWMSRALTRLPMAPRRIAIVALYVTWGAMWFKLIISSPRDPVWWLAADAALIVAFVAAVLAYYSPDEFWTSKPFQWNDLSKESEKASDSYGWGVMITQALRNAALVSGLGFAAILGIWVLGSNPWEIRDGKMELMTMALALVVIAPIAAPIPTIRVARYLPLKVSGLTANILLAAFIPQVLLVLAYTALAATGLTTLPAWWAWALIALTPVLVGSRMRFEAAGATAILAAVMGVLFGVTAFVVAFGHGRLTLSTLGRAAIWAGASAIAIAGTLWIHQQLLAGRDRNLNLGPV